MTPYTINRIVGGAVAGKNIRVMLFSAPEIHGRSQCLFFEGNGKRVAVVVKRNDSPAKLSKRAKHAVAVIEKSGGVSPVMGWHFAEQNKSVKKTAKNRGRITKMSAKLRMVDGFEVEISDDEYRRIRRAIEKSSTMVFQSFRVFGSGVIANMADVALIEPGAGWDAEDVRQPQPPTQEMPEPDAEQAVENKQPKAPGLTSKQLNDLMVASGLDTGDVAAATAYSQATVRMALKEDNRISSEFAAKVRAAYPDFFEGK